MFRTLLVVLAVASSHAHAAGPAFPVKAGENGRSLVDQKGQPFLVAGDSAWSLIVQPREEDIDRYLEVRAKKGFNSLIVNLIEHKFCTRPPQTRAGVAPFEKAGDFSTPNSDYFDFAHRVVQKANDCGIAVWLCPAYLGFGGGDEGWFREMKTAGRASLRGLDGELLEGVNAMRGEWIEELDDLAAAAVVEADPSEPVVTGIRFKVAGREWSNTYPY
jgi:hypothetical protein